MATIYSDFTASVTEFKARPRQTVEAAGGKPVAVLSHNEPIFYAVPTDLFEQIADILDDYALAEIVRERLKNPDIVRVTLDELYDGK